MTERGGKGEIERVKGEGRTGQLKRRKRERRQLYEIGRASCRERVSSPV